MTIWKQGQFYPELGKTVVELPGKVAPGPSDDMISIMGFEVLPDEDGNFIQDRHGMPFSNDELDAINTFAVIRMVIDIFEELLGRQIKWSWWKGRKKNPLLVEIRNPDVNTRFIRKHKLIQLDYYGTADVPIYTCRSVDLIAHETGHAILDTIRPMWSEGNAETRGLEESFCDLSAMFFVLNQKYLCEEVIKETKGNLKMNSILSLFGAGYGIKDQPKNAIRSANNIIQYQKGDWDWYTYSQVVTGILYDILVEIFNDLRKQYSEDAEALFQSGREWMKKIVRCFIACQFDSSSILEFCLTVQNEFSNYDVNKYIQSRKIF